MRLKISLVLAIALLGVNSVARAQNEPATPVPQAPPAAPVPQPYPYPYAPNSSPGPQQQTPGGPVRPSVAPAPNGEYIAPLQQYTQPVYVPQSVALSGPRVITDWRPDMPIPPGYHPAERVRRGAIISGLITFGIPYICSSLVAAVGSDAGSSTHVQALWIPVLGPFIEIGQSSSVTLDYLLVIDGLVQGLGAGLFIYGASSPRTVLIRNDLAMLTVSPVRLGRDGNGVGLLGRF